MQRIIHLNIDDEERLEVVTQAIGAKIRREIMRLLRHNACTVADLARKVGMPISTVAFHVNVLKKAGFVNVTVKRNTRGNAKLISRQIDHVSVDFGMQSERDQKICVYTETIPIGSFVKAEVRPGCGIADENNIIVADDLPGAFFSPARLNAQILWFTSGYIEYNVPNFMLSGKKVQSISFSMELCSEAPNFRNDWESDITFWINGHELCTYNSLGDYGGRRGRLTPDWWSDYSTQYGIMNTIKVTNEFTYLNENVVGGQTLEKLGVTKGDYFTFRIGIKDNAKHVGGLNLFGEKFGDYAQGLVYSVDYLE